jgi:short subunit fatty acids transporter
MNPEGRFYSFRKPLSPGGFFLSLRCFFDIFDNVRINIRPLSKNQGENAVKNKTDQGIPITETLLADRRHAALAIIEQVLAENRYVLVVAKEDVSVVDGEIRSESDVRFEIRKFTDNDPESEFAIHLNSEASKYFVHYAVSVGMFTLTNVDVPFARHRLTLNRNVAGKMLTGE